MEMPSRRPRSYISDLTTSKSTIDSTIVEGLESPLHKTKSNKELSTSLPAESSSKLSLSKTRSKSQEAGLCNAAVVPLDDQIDEQYKKEFEKLLEQLSQTPFKKKYSSITVPTSVKYSTMAYRPRSPKKGNELEQEQERMQDELDQAILLIREKLGMLTSERVTMEKQMDELTTGINQARVQCHNQCRQKMMAENNGIRTRRSTYSPRTVYRKPLPNFSNSLQNEHKRSGSPALLSPDSTVSSPENIAHGHRSVSVTDSGYGSLNRKSKSTELSAKVRSPSFSSTPNVSLSQGNEYYHLSNTTIPELPETSCFSQPSPTVHRRADRLKSSPTLHYASYTAPRHHRSHSASITPPPLINVTSSPDLSSRRKHDSHPYPSHRNSLPESVMNKIIEDEVDFVSVSDSLSQASLSQLSSFNEECSPKSRGSTVIVRRSSLTGQVEHIRRPRKRNSFTERADSKITKDSSLKSHSTHNLTGADCRVLNTGYKKNRRSKVILANSIETTV